MQSKALPKTSFAAVYYPWTRIPDPLKRGRLRLTSPSGSVAGVIARMDATRGVWKAPVGEEAGLQGMSQLEYAVTDADISRLNARGVNCLRTPSGAGPIVWGARTLEGDDQLGSEWKYIPVQRLALFIEENIDRGTKWAVFEPNDEPLWAKIRLDVDAFLHALFLQGAFQGATPRDAYFVKCGQETMTTNDIRRGVVNILVGFAPLKPSEFVIVSIRQKASNG